MVGSAENQIHTGASLGFSVEPPPPPPVCDDTAVALPSVSGITQDKQVHALHNHSVEGLSVDVVTHHIIRCPGAFTYDEWTDW